jgi:hypothetical protein
MEGQETPEVLSQKENVYDEMRWKPIREEKKIDKETRNDDRRTAEVDPAGRKPKEVWKG